MWQPASGIVMNNDIGDTNPEEAAAYIALSKNGYYVMSATGGKVSLFNMMTFKALLWLSTCLGFHPQDNNIIAIGMEDSSFQIYNVRVDEVKTNLKGQQKKITCLAFSHVLNTLVSSGADAQLCLWGIDEWDKRKSRVVLVQPGRSSPPVKSCTGTAKKIIATSRGYKITVSL